MNEKPKVPSPTIRGTYNTYENMTNKDLVQALGHVVTLHLENIAMIEIGSWGTTLKIKTPPGIKVHVKSDTQGNTIYLS